MGADRKPLVLHATFGLGVVIEVDDLEANLLGRRSLFQVDGGHPDAPTDLQSRLVCGTSGGTKDAPQSSHTSADD
jgi:hypothetical protein